MSNRAMRHPIFISSALAGALLGAVVAGGFIEHSHALAQSRPASASAPPPFDLADSGVIGEGAQLFRQTCTGYCHGKDGGASRAPKLRAQKLERGYVYARIMKGSPNGMPAFEASLSQDKIWKLVAYVLSLSNAE